jgi:hypothetical protein
MGVWDPPGWQPYSARRSSLQRSKRADGFSPLQFSLHQRNSAARVQLEGRRNDFDHKKIGGERGRNRTFNMRIKSPLLYQLSYAPAEISLTYTSR